VKRDKIHQNEMKYMILKIRCMNCGRIITISNPKQKYCNHRDCKKERAKLWYKANKNQPKPKKVFIPAH